jgi:succinate dehydrogenase / fumarate reductase cytochrome b subunit
MVYKYVDASPLNETRYFHELAENLKVRTGLYSYHFYYYHCTCGTGSVLLFNPLGLIISIQIKRFGYAFAIVVPLGSFYCIISSF